MKLMTKEILAKLPKLYSQENNPDPQVVVKFFDPCGSWTWYATEGEPEGDDVRFFGWVHGFEDELGYFMLSDLQSVKGPLGLGIERDLHWDPKTTLSQVKSGEKR
jgi:hypothetical protein